MRLETDIFYHLKIENNEFKPLKPIKNFNYKTDRFSSLNSD